MSRQSSRRIDEQVYFTMGGVLVLALVVLGFRVAVRKECTPVSISSGPDRHLVNISVNFQANAPEGVYTWDFGDGSPLEKGTTLVNHTYKTAGQFTVHLIAGKCTNFTDVFISEPRPRLITPEAASVTGPGAGTTNQPIVFTDTSSKHTSWVWYDGEHAIPVSREKTAVIKYSVPGYKTISVKVNNKEIIYKYIEITEDPAIQRANMAKQQQQQQVKDQHIDVHINKDPIEQPLPNPTQDNTKKETVKPMPEPIKVKFPEVKESEFEGYLLDYHKGTREKDFFYQYFCSKVNVQCNGKSDDFSGLLNTIKGFRKIKSIKVTIGTDPETGCVQKITATVTKAKLIDRILNKDQ